MERLEERVSFCYTRPWLLRRMTFHPRPSLFLIFASGYLLLLSFILFSQGNFFADLLINFLPYLTAFHIAFFFCFEFFAPRYQIPHFRNRIFSSLFIFLLFVQSVLFLSPYLHSEKGFASTEMREIKVLSANILRTNREMDDLLQLIEDYSPDLLTLIELTPEVTRDLEVLKVAYPYYEVLPKVGGDGIALYSRYSFESLEPIFSSEYGPFIKGRVIINGQAIDVFAVHAPAPLLPRLFEKRTVFFKEVSSQIDPGTPTMVMGDFNLTPWSSIYVDFVRENALSNARSLRNGIQNSFGLLGVHIPIDHILVSPDLVVKHHEVGPEIGSDHLPLLAEISITHAL